MPKAATLFTPTYARDFERFCLQRESIERCGIDLPHVAVVNHEDLALFAKVPHRRGLTLLSAHELLPASYDRRRQVWGYSRRDYRYWITGRGIHGWLFQQLLKLASPAVVDTDGIVCLDSDALFVSRVTADDFFAPDGRLHLYETTDDLDTEMAEWYAHSLRFFGEKVTGVPLRRFTHAPVPMHRAVLLDMQKFIENRHGQSWMEAIIAADRIMEYTTYGAFARHIDGLKRVCPTTPTLTLYYWWADEVKLLHSHFEQQIAARQPKIVLVNSNIGLSVESYRNLLARAWPGTDSTRDMSGCTVE
jgi:hypothetical protein